MKFFSISLISATLFAGDISASTEKCRDIDNFGIMSGLSDGDVMSITQDSKGYIWAATANGLNRFDGARFINYTVANSGLGSNALNCVTQLPGDPDHLWIGTQRDGIFYFEQSSGEIKPLDAEGLLSVDVTTINPASDGGMWINYYNFGPQYYNPHTGVTRDCSYRVYGNLPRECWVTTEGRDGILYVGHAGEGFSVIDTRNGQVTTYRHNPSSPSIPGNEVYSVCVADDGNVWIGTDRGAAIYFPSTKTFIPYVNNPSDPASILPGRIRHISQAPDGSVWFASTLAGVCVLNTPSNGLKDLMNARFIRIPANEPVSGTSNAYARTIYPDSYGNIWIGNYRTGIDVINHTPSGFSRIAYLGQRNASSSYLPAWSCAYAPDGTLWIGGENEIAAICRNEVKKIPLPPAPDTMKTFVKALKTTGDGKVWIGTYDRGAMIYDPRSGNFSSVKGVNPDVRAMADGAGGDVFIGTDKGLYVCASGNLEGRFLEAVNSRLKDLVVQSILIDSLNRLWIGTFGSGVYVFGPGMELEGNIRKADGLPSNAVSDIKQDSSGKIWIATRGGIAVVDNPDNPSRFRIIANSSGNALQVKALQEDKHHNIWISATDGIGRLTHDGEWKKFYRYSPSRPLHTFMEGASAIDPEGNIYFASSNGVFRIDPVSILRTSSHMPAVITDFSIFKDGGDNHENRQHVPVNGKVINLPYDSNTFLITFNVPDHSLSSATDFECRLVGADNVWTTPSSPDNTMLYRNLRPGTYRFLIRQRCDGQEWDKAENILTITIDPPLWLTWWAKCLYLLSAMVIIFFGLRLYRNRVKLAQQIIALEESNRNRQALNEERLRFFTNITHELRTPLTLILGPLEDLVSDPKLPAEYSGKLQMIRNSSTQLLNLINSILEFRKTETQNRRLKVKPGNLANLLREIGLGFKELNRNREVNIVLDIDDDRNEILFDPDVVTIIVNNIMINAMKYTPKGTVTLSCHMKARDGARWYVIKVADTGYGIPREKMRLIFERYYQVDDTHQASGTGIGLALVKSLAEIHHALLDVESEPGKGSVFSVWLPADDIYPEALRGTAERKAEHGQDNIKPQASADKTKILVVEDNHDLRTYICRCLEGEFYVIQAKDGLEGLRLAHEEMPDLILTDIMMPEMDGIAMCRSIKDDIQTSHIQVVMLTAKDSMAEKQEGYEAGATSYLTKPFTAKLLLARIRNIIRQQRTLSEHLRSIPIPASGQPIISIPTPTGTNNPDNDHNSDNDTNLHNMDTNIISPLDREFIEKFIAIINENLSNPELGVSFIASKLCMSNSTLYRKVMAVLGIPTNEYIRRIRMQKSRELLDAGKLTITDIAFETGFGTHSSFAKAFKKEFGMTASEYMARKEGK